jgi:hypothetical protein
MPNRFRADLIDVAWAPEQTFGVNPWAAGITATALNSTQTTTANTLYGQWGLVTGGVDLPNPTYEWTPFFGLGVLDRNMMFPVQGRERLEGRLGGVLFCQDSSRLFLGQCLGLIFNGHNCLDADGDVATSTVVTPGYTSTQGALVVTDTTATVTGKNVSTVKRAGTTAPPIAIIIVTDIINTVPDRVHDTWAYIGGEAGNSSTAELEVYMDYGLTQTGWNGVRPTTGTTRFSVHSITTPDYNNNNSVLGVSADTADGNYSFIRPTLTQSSFMLGARFRADDGSNFITNYMGCKVARCVFNFEEGNPVNYGADFIAQDMRHNIGEDVTGITSDNTKTLKYAAETTAVAAGGTIAPSNSKLTRVTEQPYFFSRITLTFQGVDIARFRRFSLTVDNQLDPRYYISQNASGSPAEGRQILTEILEGRRNISFSGSLDLDDDGQSYPDYDGTGGSPKDANFVRYLLNQAYVDTDIRDMATLKGVGIKIELRRVSDASGGSSRFYDKCIFYIPTGARGLSNQNVIGTQDNVGMVLRSATMNVPAPPNIHVPIDIDGFASSMFVEFQDNVVV